jgi:hypothetical protein
MGFFSWRTSDTERSISNEYSKLDTFTVHMITEDGVIFTEHNYEGYGVFGGKDFYALVAELNGFTQGTQDEKRMKGIDICFHDNPSGEYNGTFKYPKLVEEMLDVTQWEKQWNELDYPKCCDLQGFFYDDDEEVEEEEYEEEEQYEEW